MKNLNYLESLIICIERTGWPVLPLIREIGLASRGMLLLEKQVFNESLALVTFSECSPPPDIFHILKYFSNI